MLRPRLFSIFLCLSLGGTVLAGESAETAAAGESGTVDARGDLITEVELERIVSRPLNFDLREFMGNARDPGAPPDPDAPEKLRARLLEQGFEFVSYKENFVPLPNGTQMELHELTIKNIKTGEVHKLVLRQKANVGTLEAEMSFTWDGKITSLVRVVDQKFTLPPDPGVEYLVLSISDNEVKVRRLTDGKEFLIRKPLL